jgi:hypothetical protein
VGDVVGCEHAIADSGMFMNCQKAADRPIASDTGTLMVE